MRSVLFKDKEYTRVEHAVMRAFSRMQNGMPRDTGLLAEMAFKLDFTDTGWKMFVDLQVSPYAVYLERFPQHKGWWEWRIKLVINEIANELTGAVNENPNV